MSSPQSLDNLFSLIRERYYELKENPLNKKVKKDDLFNKAVTYIFGLWGERFNIPSASDLKGAFSRSRGKKKKEKLSISTEQPIVFLSPKKEVENYSLEDIPFEEQLERLGLNNGDNY